MKIKLCYILTFLMLNFSFFIIVGQSSPVKGYIIEIKDGKVYLDLTASQVQAGTRLKVVREGGVFTHPVTGAEIKEEDETVANLEITEVKANYSLAIAIPSSAISLLAKGMVVNALTEGETVSSAFRKSIAVQPLTVSNIQGFLGIYIGDVLTEKLLAQDNYKVLDRQTLGLKLDHYLLSNQGTVSQAEILQYSKSTGADYYITGTMYEPDVVEVSSGVPVKDIVKIAGFAAEAITGKDLKVDAIASFVPERVEVKKLRSIVKLNLKVVDVNTGEILFLCTEMQESTGESEINLEGGMLGGLKLQGGAATFLNTVTGQATNKALENLMGYIMGYFDGTIKTKTYTGNVIEIGHDKTAIAKINTEPKIVKIEEINNEKVATINKGRKTKAKGGKPREGNSYAVFMPEYETSSITGQNIVTGKEKVGMVSDIQVEHDASKGTLKLDSEISEEDLIQKSILRQMQDRKGFKYEVGVDMGLPFIYEYEYEGGANLGVYARAGYFLNSNFYLGIGAGLNSSEIEVSADSSIAFLDNTFVRNLPLYFSIDLIILEKKIRPFLTFNFGGYIFQNMDHYNEYIDYRGLYNKIGIGVKVNTNAHTGLSLSIIYENLGRIEANDEILAKIRAYSLNLGFFF